MTPSWGNYCNNECLCNDLCTILSNKKCKCVFYIYCYWQLLGRQKGKNAECHHKIQLTSFGSGSIDENFRFEIDKSSSFILTMSSAFDIERLIFWNERQKALWRHIFILIKGNTKYFFRLFFHAKSPIMKLNFQALVKYPFQLPLSSFHLDNKKKQDV
jgi:hypothetical protein